MNEDDLSKMLDMGEAGEVSLADLANINMDEVEEVRFQILPKMSGIFEITKMELTVRNTANSGEKPVLAGEFKVLEVISCLDDDIDEASLPGREHRQAWFIGVGDSPDPVKDIGRWKAFLADAGFQSAGQKLNAICDACVGHQFISAINHRKDPNDKDKTYASFDGNKTKPYNPAEQGDGQAA